MTRTIRTRPLALLARAVAAACVVLLAALLPGAAGADATFALVDTGELYVSGDGGVTWSIRATLPVHDAVALAAGVSSTQLFLATKSGSFYSSADAGVSWTAAGAVPAADVAAMVCRFGTITLITASGSVFRSTDSGATFAAVGSIPASDVASAVWWVSYFAVTRTGEVYQSSDNGATWSVVGSIGSGGVVAMVMFAGELYALTSTGEIAHNGGPRRDARRGCGNRPSSYRVATT